MLKTRDGGFINHLNPQPLSWLRQYLGSGRPLLYTALRKTGQLWRTSPMLNQQTHAQNSPAPAPSNNAEPEDPLDLYFRLSDHQRQERFLDTDCIARKFSLSQRTVQYWINQGLISAVPVGKKKYKVDLRSVEAFLLERARQRQAN
jgi:hypothetical protein